MMLMMLLLLLIVDVWSKLSVQQRVKRAAAAVMSRDVSESAPGRAGTCVQHTRTHTHTLTTVRHQPTLYQRRSLLVPCPDKAAEYCDERVCLSVCLYLMNHTYKLHQFSTHVA